MSKTRTRSSRESVHKHKQRRALREGVHKGGGRGVRWQGHLSAGLDVLSGSGLKGRRDTATRWRERWEVSRNWGG